jgi:DNA-binding transcriptional LysR family regulator
MVFIIFAPDDQGYALHSARMPSSSTCIICTFDVQIDMIHANRPLNASLPNVAAFVASVEEKSFSAAARRLGVTPQATSRAVARLEQTMSVALFRRTTRSLVLTEAGERYFQSCASSLQILRQAEEDLRLGSRVTSGVVRISAPTSYGHALLPSQLAAFQTIHPQVTLHVNLNNRNIDFVRDGYDLAIRMGTLHNESSLRRVGLGSFPLGVFASPDYLRRHGTPQTAEDIDQHRTIVFMMPRTNRVLPWSFQGREPLVPQAKTHVSDDVMGLATLAAAGMGLIQTYHFLVAPWVARRELVEVMREVPGDARPFSVVFPRAPQLSRPARALLEHLRR